MSRAKKRKKSTTITEPTTLAACHALIAELTSSVDQLTSTVDEQAVTIESLRQEKKQIEAEFALWMHRIFARRSERYINDPNQLKLDLGGIGIFNNQRMRDAHRIEQLAGEDRLRADRAIFLTDDARSVHGPG